MLRSGEGWRKACGVPCGIKFSLTHFLWTLYVNTAFLRCVASGYCDERAGIKIYCTVLWKYWTVWFKSYSILTRRSSNHESRLLSRSHTFAIIVIFNRFENTSKYVDTLTLFSKNLNQRSLTPRWPLTPCLLRSHVWLYPRIIVSKSHDDTSMYVDTVINFANYHIHTYTYYVHTTYRMSDHIVSYWTQFRRDKNERYRRKLHII